MFVCLQLKDGDKLAVKLNRSTILENGLDDKKKIWKLGGPSKKGAMTMVDFSIH